MVEGMMIVMATMVVVVMVARLVVVAIAMIMMMMMMMVGLRPTSPTISGEPEPRRATLERSDKSANVR